ncbi:MSHA biogenesis protein MshK [Thaumasiovibrio sp. DFM-14]|uniref:MSHA biogenesis protein MshK n=1 Tax=Thaumasiovibrio sp. DFM-14 TaxID=3384792 RepID=UPI0039A1A7E1
MVRILSALTLFLSTAVSATWVDPTAPLGQMPPPKQQAKPLVAPTLEGIICVSECRAVLNGTSVSSGETIQGFYVAAIQSDQVTLRHGRKTLALTLFQDHIKQ